MPPPRLLLLAQNREGFGNLCEFITLGRTRAEKGSYLLYPSDLASPEPAQAHLRGMPDCLAILLPDYCADPDVLRAQALWCRETFGARVWIALELLQGHAEALHRTRLQAVSAENWRARWWRPRAVTMHVRSAQAAGRCADRDPARPAAAPLCGMALAPNAEAHPRMRQVVSRLYPREALAQTPKIAEQCRFSLDTLRYEYPEELAPDGETPISYLRARRWSGAGASAFRTAWSLEWEARSSRASSN